MNEQKLQEIETRWNRLAATRVKSHLRTDIPLLIAALREAWEERDTYRSAYAALLYDEPLDNGEYVHVGTCNASRNKPVGNDMCSCPIGRRVKS